MIYSEEHLELLKQEMLAEEGFSLRSAYNLFDEHNKGFITQLGLETGLDKLRVEYDSINTGRLIWEKSGNGRLRFEEFCSILLPDNEQDSSAIAVVGPKKLPFRASDALGHVLQEKLLLLSASEKFKFSLATNENLKNQFADIHPNTLQMRSLPTNAAYSVMGKVFDESGNVKRRDP